MSSAEYLTRSTSFRLRALVFWALACLIQIIPSAEARPQSHLEVLADEVEVELEQATTHFRKNVHISLRQYQIQCQQATVRLNTKTRILEEIIMIGQVLIQSPEGSVRSKKAIFTPRTNRLHLEGPIYSRFRIELPATLNP